MGAVERAPFMVKLAAFTALFFAPAACLRLGFVLTTARWDGIAVGLLPIAALALAGAVASVQLLRPSERTGARVRVVARGLVAYGIPLFCFGLLHDVVVYHPSEGALSLGTASAELGGAAIVVGLLLLRACRQSAFPPS
jgi:hypothetical protein